MRQIKQQHLLSNWFAQMHWLLPYTVPHEQHVIFLRWVVLTLFIPAFCIGILWPKERKSGILDSLPGSEALYQCQKIKKIQSREEKVLQLKLHKGYSTFSVQEQTCKWKA